MQFDLSQSIHLPIRPPIQERLRTLFSFLEPNPARNAPLRCDFDVTADDLIRLAETAPHLLSDIGFVKDPHRSNHLRSVWISDQAEIEILNQE